MTRALPPELWISIFSCVTYVPHLLNTGPRDVFASPATPTYLESSKRLRDSFATKFELMRVCKYWGALSERFAYEAVLLNSLENLIALIECLSQPCSGGTSSSDETQKGVTDRHRGHYTRRLDILFTERDRRRLTDLEPLQREVFAKSMVDIARLTQLCPRLDIFVNNLVVREPSWIEGLHMDINMQVLSSLHIPLQVMHFNNALRCKPRALIGSDTPYDFMTNLLSNVRVLSGAYDWLEMSTGGELFDSTDVGRTFQHVEALSMNAYYLNPLLQLPKLRSLATGDGNQYDRADLQPFLAAHGNLLTTLDLSSTDGRSFIGATQAAAFLTPECLPVLRDLILEIGEVSRVLPHARRCSTISRLGIASRYHQASRNSYALFARLLSPCTLAWEHFEVLRFLNDRIVVDLQTRHGAFLVRWFSPISNHGVRFEQSTGSVLPW